MAALNSESYVMRAAVGLVLASLLPGCALLGYHKAPKAPYASAEEAQKVVFPNSYEEGVHLDGPSMAALEVARNEFMPPGAKATSDNPKLAECLARRDVYDVTVIQSNENLYFVSFIPKLERCGLQDVVLMDAGAVYAIDGKGRVLSVL
ncbi:hypothetical protein NVS55_18260 [Myxococcus stipitatus]|uniref:hypothetical protein n=1 Tax=Myxococcus stipitatus TaxID=83455 RepID=UPI0031456732